MRQQRLRPVAIPQMRHDYVRPRAHTSPSGCILEKYLGTDNDASRIDIYRKKNGHGLPYANLDRAFNLSLKVGTLCLEEIAHDPGGRTLVSYDH